MRERAVAIGSGLLVCVASAGLAACGGSGSARPSTAGASPSTATSAPTTSTASARGRSPGNGPASRARPRQPRRPSVHGPKVGTTQSVHAYGAFLHVTVTGVGAVAPGDAATLPGTRGVAVAVRIADEAGATYDSTASGDFSVIVSRGQTAPLDIRAGACETQLVDFESHLYSGDVRTGCVGFSVPRHARVLGVRFSPHARPPHSVTWRIGA
jgi:hypothetical protein